MGKVEAESAGLDQRPRLLNVLAQDAAQRPVQYVSAGVRLADALAPVAIDRECRLLPHSQPAFGDLGVVPVEPMHGQLGIGHPSAAGLGGQRAGIAHLPARLCVEGSPVEVHLHQLPGLGLFHRFPLAHDAEDAPHFVQAVVTDELGGP